MRLPEALYSKWLPVKVAHFMVKGNAMSMRALLQTELVVSTTELLHASSRAHVAESDQAVPHCSCFLMGATLLRAVQATNDGEATVLARQFLLPLNHATTAQKGTMEGKSTHRTLSKDESDSTIVGALIPLRIHTVSNHALSQVLLPPQS